MVEHQIFEIWRPKFAQTKFANLSGLIEKLINNMKWRLVRAILVDYRYKSTNVEMVKIRDYDVGCPKWNVRSKSLNKSVRNLRNTWNACIKKSIQWKKLLRISSKKLQNWRTHWMSRHLFWSHSLPKCEYCSMRCKYAQ